MSETYDSADCFLNDSLAFRTADGHFFGSELLINGKPVKQMTKLVIWADIEENRVRWKAEFNVR